MAGLCVSTFLKAEKAGSVCSETVLSRFFTFLEAWRSGMLQGTTKANF